MNVGLYNRTVHPKSLAIFQTHIHGCLHHQFINSLVAGSQSVKGAVKGIVLRHRLAVEIRELAQRTRGDSFAQFGR
jgi:hypothetical protein